LAEYVIGACLYFAKDFARLDKQKEGKIWDRYNMKELSGATMGIIGSEILLTIC
jgi:phosphoglycerate dehydrogenase-like enzyme